MTKKRVVEGPEGARAKPERASGSGNLVAREEAMVVEVEVDQDLEEFARGGVNYILLPIKQVRKARSEAMSHIEGKMFKVVKRSEAWERTGEPPITTKCVDADKMHGTGAPTVRSRWVARDFRGQSEKDHEDLFSATPRSS